jgi:carboxypeptidase C (cathepsin A)
MVSKILLVGLFCVALASPAFEQKEILGDTDGSWSYLGVTGYAGYISMNSLTGSSLFYWLFEAIDGNITTDNLPLILWLQGGPGCSGSFGMLWEAISPITVNQNTQPIRTPLNHTWGTNYHIMSVDFPYGAGYSVAFKASDERNTTQEATFYLYKFLRTLGGKYPQWFNRPFYIFGESYGGHWVPGLAWNILQQNALNLTGFQVPLKGIGIGDPWVDAPTQTQTYAQYALSASLINNYEMNVVNHYQSLVITELDNNQPLQAERNWENSYDAIVSFSGGVNVYNVREYGNYNEDVLTAFMNTNSTKEMLHVNAQQTWVSCNDSIYDYYKADIMNSSIIYFPYILSQGVTVMIYNGQDDLIVNSPGIENMMANIDWPGAQDFEQAPKMNWTVNGNMAGYAQSYNNLTFVLLLASGHMGPYDQPINVKNMVERYINGTGWD